MVTDVIVFGSYARNNYDKFSDLDLIYITDNLEEAKNLYKNYFSKGAISYDEIRFLEFISKGSFLSDHLRENSIVLKGNKFNYKYLINSIKISNYVYNDLNKFKDYYDAVNFFLVPEKINLKLWQMDILYLVLKT